MTSVPVRSLTVTLSAPPSALKVTNSTPPVSIVMFAGLRKNRSRFPFADRSTVSEAAAPLNTMVSLPSSPSIVSLPSPGSQTNVSSPAPRAALVVAAVAVDRVVAVAAEERLRARAAGDRVVAVPAVEELGDRAGRKSGGGDVVVAAEALDEELVGRLLMLDRDLRLEAGHRDAGRVAGGGRSHRSALVPMTTTRSVWPSPVVPPSVPARSRLTFLTSVPVRSLTVTESAPPSALKSTCSTPWVSIVMFAGLRKNRSRSPFADRSTVSEAAAPLNTIVSVPSLPSIVSLPSPGSQTNVSSPAPRSETSLPPLPSIVSLPGPPFSVSATGTAGDRVVARTSVDPRRDGVGERAVAVVDAHPVVAAARLDADALDRGPREAEVGGPVVAEIHLDDGGVAGREPKRDRIVRLGPPHAQGVMCEPRACTLEVVPVPSRGSLSGVGRGRCDGDDGCRRHRQEPPRRRTRSVTFFMLVPFRVVDPSAA